MRARSAILLAAAVCGCAPERPPAQPAPEPPPALVAAKPAPSGVEKSGYLPEIDEALELMTEVRELSAKERVQGMVIQRDALLDRLKGDVTADLRTELVLGTTELLFGLNVVPGSFDFLKDVTGLYTSQLAGFYDPEEKRMYLLADLGEDAERSTLWHELVHALQDQHYDLKKIADWSPDATDRISAIQCLAEGDATSAMMDAMLAPQAMRATDLPDGFLGPDAVLIEGNASLKDVPPVLKRSIMAPYSDGIGFVHHLRRKGGWASVDLAWQKLPESTEQILHPEKYLAGEAPEVVPIPPAPVKGATLAYHDVLGEQTFRLLFQDWMPVRTAVESAKDWAGDRVAVYSWGTTRAVALRLRFDNAEAAERSAHAFVRGALGPEFEKGASPGSGLPPVSAEKATSSFRAGQFCAERESRGPFAIERKGRELAIAIGPFSRSDGAPKSAGSCADALVWTKSVLAAH